MAGRINIMTAPPPKNTAVRGTILLLAILIFFIPGCQKTYSRPADDSSSPHSAKNQAEFFTLLEKDGVTTAEIEDELKKDPTLIRARNENGETPLIIAAFVGDKAVIELLLKNGADVRETSVSNGTTALHYAAGAPGRREIIELLIKHGAEVNARNAFGETPLFISAVLDTPENSDILLKNGADINSVDNHGNTPLHRAAYYGNLNKARFLLDKGIDAARQNREGKTALDQAKERNNQSMEKLLQK